MKDIKSNIIHLPVSWRSIFKATDTNLFASLLLQFAKGKLLSDLWSKQDDYSLLSSQRAQNQWEGFEKSEGSVSCHGAVGVESHWSPSVGEKSVFKYIQLKHCIKHW